MQEAEGKSQEAQEALQRLEESEAAKRALEQQVAAAEGRSEELVEGLKVSHWSSDLRRPYTAAPQVSHTWRF